MKKIYQFKWQQWVIIIGFLLSLAVIGLFSIRAVRYMPSRHIDESIRPWMTLPYIAHSYRVPEEFLYQALGLPYTAQDKRPIIYLAREQNRSIEKVIILLKNAIIEVRSLFPSPTPPLPEPKRSTP